MLNIIERAIVIIINCSANYAIKSVCLTVKLLLPKYLLTMHSMLLVRASRGDPIEPY